MPSNTQVGPKTRESAPTMTLVFRGPSTGTTISRSFRGDDPDVPSVVKVRFEPGTRDEQLRGAPEQLFEDATPDPGQPLIAILPVPTSTTLTISDRSGRQLEIPVSIRRD